MTTTGSIRSWPGLRTAGGLLAASAIFLSTVGPSGAVTSQPSADAATGRRVVAIAPHFPRGTILVSLEERRLYLVRRNGTAISYPVATPRDEDVWTGTQVITAKRPAPPWRPTPEMRLANPRLPGFVPGGHPFNPMGSHALYLGNTYYRIHGTDAPWLVGSNVSKGCLRLHNDHVREIFDEVEVGTKVIVTREGVAGKL